MINSDFIGHWEGIIQVEKDRELLEKIKKHSVNSIQTEVEKLRQNAQRYNDNRVIDVAIKDDVVQVYYKNDPYPNTGYPDIESVWTVATYKHFIPLIGSNLANMGMVKRGITVLAILFNKNIASEWLKYIFSMHRVLLEERYYIPMVKEVRRVLRPYLEENLLNGFTMILEYDNAYRYMFQDIVPLLDKEAFNKSWRRELRRVMAILINRCTSKDQQIFRNVAKLLPLYLTFSPKSLKTFKSIVNDLDFDKIKPSESDYYWMLWLRTYNCFGISNQEKENKIKDLGGVYTE